MKVDSPAIYPYQQHPHSQQKACYCIYLQRGPGSTLISAQIVARVQFPLIDPPHTPRGLEIKTSTKKSVMKSQLFFLLIFVLEAQGDCQESNGITSSRARLVLNAGARQYSILFGSPVLCLMCHRPRGSYRVLQKPPLAASYSSW